MYLKKPEQLTIWKGGSIDEVTDVVQSMNKDPKQNLKTKVLQALSKKENETDVVQFKSGETEFGVSTVDCYPGRILATLLVRLVAELPPYPS